MSASFRLKTEHNGNELNVLLSGDFDGDSAWELANLLMLKNPAAAVVCVNTLQVRTVAPFGAALLKNLLSLRIIRSGRIFFDGMAAARAVEGEHRLFADNAVQATGAGCHSHASIR